MLTKFYKISSLSITHFAWSSWTPLHSYSIIIAQLQWPVKSVLSCVQELQGHVQAHLVFSYIYAGVARPEQKKFTMPHVICMQLIAPLCVHCTLHENTK